MSDRYNCHCMVSSALICTLLYSHGHPSLQSWSPFSTLKVTYLCTHGQHSWSPFAALMVTLFCTHCHPSLHSWSSFSALMPALMVTLLCTHACTHGHLLCTHGHPSLHSLSPFSTLMVTLRCTHRTNGIAPKAPSTALKAPSFTKMAFIKEEGS